MFDGLSGRLRDIFDGIGRRGALSEQDVDQALRSVRRALLEADVEIGVVRQFIADVRPKAIGQEVLKSVTPGQMVIKIIHDQLVTMLGEESSGIDLNAQPPAVIMMVGLQGAGKTTTTAKLGRMLSHNNSRRIIMASLDTYRPAAQEQLRVLGEQTGINTLPVVNGQSPEQIAERAIKVAQLSGYDVLILDTAGRNHVNSELMAELQAIKRTTNPHEILLVADALTGQDAVNVASSFDDAVGISGLVLTRIDGDGRGGAALSMRAVTGKPIKLMGVGEKIDALQTFHPDRIARQILGMGDLVSLVEKASASIDADKSAELAKKVQKGFFDLNDMAEQLRNMSKLGDIGGIMGLLPGMAKAKKQLAAANIDEKMFKRQEAVIMSMTAYERTHPKVLNGSRKRRVAAGAGVQVQDVNRLLKMHRQLADFIKKAGRGKSGLSGLLGGGVMGGAMGGAMGGIGGLMGGKGAMVEHMLGNNKREGLPELPDMNMSGAGGASGIDFAALSGGLSNMPLNLKKSKKRK